MNTRLIAHRGEPTTYPENSLLGYEAVLHAGAAFIETDVQITADGIPVLSHDATVQRITGYDHNITTTGYDTIRTLPAGQREKFGIQFDHLHIARLDQFASLLKKWPEAKAFVEAKRASIRVFGAETVIDTILSALHDVLPQCIMISFDPGALFYTRKVSAVPTGWVLPEWSAENREIALQLKPDYLFCNRKRLPPATEPLWSGAWQWVIYTVNEPADIPRFLQRGADMLETDRISKLLAEQGPDSGRG